MTSALRGIAQMTAGAAVTRRRQRPAHLVVPDGPEPVARAHQPERHGENGAQFNGAHERDRERQEPDSDADEVMAAQRFQVEHLELVSPSSRRFACARV